MTERSHARQPTRTAPRAAPAGSDAKGHAPRPAPAISLLPRPTPQHRLPAPISTLVGREQETEAVAALLDRARLVTLTAGGGTGKTRLALAVAGRRAASLGQPAAFVDLSAVTDPRMVPHAVAAAVGVGEEHRPVLEVLAEHLGTQESLLVLDNCEHLIDTCAAVVHHLLYACAPLRVLATSRERLAITGEVVWIVPPLSLPGRDGGDPDDLARSEAVRLFVERASAVRPDFTLDEGNAGAVADLCRRLDGNALAIELAGARADVLSPAEIGALLDDRFSVLVAGSRTASARQKTLKGALEWSFDLLSDAERALLRRLSVFAGSFTLGAAQDVCSGGEVVRAEVLDLMSKLVAKSLLVAERRGQTTRYRLLETVKEYAGELLTEAGEVAEHRALQAAWCVVTLEEASRHGPRPGQAGQWVDAIEAEQDNVRAALEWALGEGRATLALRLTRGQMAFWDVRGLYDEARTWVERALPLCEGAPEPLRARVLHDAGLIATMLGDLEGARTYLEQAMALPSTQADPRARARNRNLLGFVSTFTGNGTSVEDLEAALPELAATGDDACLAESLAACGRARMFKGDARQADEHFEHAVELARRLELEAQVGGALVGRGWAALALGRYDEAEAWLADALDVAGRLQDELGVLMARTWRAELARLRGDLARARSEFTEALALARRMAAPHPLTRCLTGLGRIALAEGDSGLAQELLTEAAGTARTAGLAQVVSAALAGLGQLALVAGDHDQARALLDEALAVATGAGDKFGAATAQHGLASVAVADGDLDSAAGLHYQALTTRDRIADAAGVAASLEGVAGLGVLRGNHELAARLFGAADRLRRDGGYGRDPLDAAACAAHVDTLRDSTAQGELEQAWAEGSELSATEAVSFALRGRGRRQARGWAGLTKVELDVVTLVEQGLTNAEIAARLLVSRETVKSHVSRIFVKVGVSNRQALRDLVRAQVRS